MSRYHDWLMNLAVSLSINPAGALWLLVVGIIAAYVAYRQGKKPWLGGLIAIGVTFVSALLLPGVLALAVGLVASCLIVYMLPG